MNIRMRLAALAAAAALSACAASPALGPAPSPDDCVAARLLSNGTHADIALPAEVFAADHPARTLYPQADYFLIGWGEQAFYMAEEAGAWKGFKAILPPSRSVLHVVAVDGSIDALAWREGDALDIALSETGARAMAAGLARSLRRDEAGAPIVLGPGRAPGRSAFLADGRGFHLFRMCNHWAAARLREAGAPVRAEASFTAPGLIKAMRRETPRACPVPATQAERVN
jgi:uncharacterized protein (TIGR02117 family)